MASTRYPTRRRVSAHPDPSLQEAVQVTRFWRNVDVQSADDCWPWLGDVDPKGGYGLFSYEGRMRRAPELALSFTTGEVRHPALDTCHKCDNPPCCNPAHLRFDTRLANVHDMYLRGRQRPFRKLSDEDVILIRERRAAGARQKDLATQYGVTDGQISMIVRGQRYATLGGPIETERKYCRRG